MRSGKSVTARLIGIHKRRVNPERWLIFHFDDEGGPNYKKASDQNNEDGWTVSRIREAEIKAAHLASRSNRQKSDKETSAATV
jgi:hypothetical protein